MNSHVTGMLVQPDPPRETACTPTSNPVTRCVFDPPEVPEQFRDPAPKRGPGRPLSYTPEVADEICERLEAGEPIKQICREAGMPDWKIVRHHPVRARVRCRRNPGGSSFNPARASAD
jgi:hypothetical protein